MRSHSALFLLLTVAFIGATAADKAKPIAIAEAGALPLGTVVTVQGSVTLPSGAFKSSFDDEGFVIQDGTSGIYVSVKTNRGLKVGQRVQVTGKLAETNAQFRIIEADANSISARGRGEIVPAKATTAASLDEKTLGQLVKVSGVVNSAIVNIAPAGFRFTIDDGTGDAV